MGEREEKAKESDPVRKAVLKEAKEALKLASENVNEDQSYWNPIKSIKKRKRLLKRWGIPEVLDKIEALGHLDPSKWSDISDDDLRKKEKLEMNEEQIGKWKTGLKQFEKEQKELKTTEEQMEKLAAEEEEKKMKME